MKLNEYLVPTSVTTDYSISLKKQISLHCEIDISGDIMLSVTHLLILSFAFISIQAGVTVHNPFYCYSEDPNREWTPLGGWYLPYEQSRADFINPNVSTCNPSKFWMISRHASRFPSAAEIVNMDRVVNAIHRQILTNYNQGRTTLCAADYELLRNWQFNPNLTVENAELISASGWNEMESLAKRLKIAFPTILTSTYSPNDYMFQSSNYQRTRYSLHAFADGLFGVNGHHQVQFEDFPVPDLYLEAHIYCTFFADLLDRVARVEMRAFIEGPEYQEMLVQVSARLGFHNSNVLRSDEIALLALYCRYDQLLNLDYTSLSPICAAFSVANAQVIEYAEDLQVYHRIGYGRPEYQRLYENVMCFTLQNLLRFIQSNDVNEHKARIFNGQAPYAVILVNFGVFDGDAILTRHNFAQQSQRVWKSSNMTPMSSNFVVIKYDCADGDNDLLFLLNEKPLQIRGCDSNGVCKQSLILERLGRFLNADCLEVHCTNS